MKTWNARVCIFMALMLGRCPLASGQSLADIELSRDGQVLPNSRSQSKLVGAEEFPQWVVGGLANSGVHLNAKAASGGDRAVGDSSPSAGRNGGGTVTERKLDRRSQIEFWSVQGVMFGTTIAAIATTHNCLQAGSCTAIPSSLQSRGAMYSVGIPMAVGVAILSYEIKKHEKRWWFVPSAMLAGAAGVLTYHSVGASH